MTDNRLRGLSPVGSEPISAQTASAVNSFTIGSAFSKPIPFRCGKCPRDGATLVETHEEINKQVNAPGGMYE